MLLLTVILAIAVLIMLMLFIFHKLEIKDVKKQIERIGSGDSNELVHSTFGGSVDAEIINEINRLLTEKRQYKETYSRKSHNLEQMITNIAHDLRTPLTSAMGYIDIILESDMPLDEKQRLIEVIHNRMKRLEELINSFFEFSKLISGDKKPDMEKLNLVGILQEAIVHYYDDFCGREREIEFVCAQTGISIHSNKNVLMRIFDNLIGNAYKHGSGTLKITVTEDEHHVIRFENELLGSSIDTERIFDEFYTTDISRTKGNTGLGLAIAKQFTQMLGGRISADYKGSTFAITVELPKE